MRLRLRRQGRGDAARRRLHAARRFGTRAVLLVSAFGVFASPALAHAQTATESFLHPMGPVAAAQQHHFYRVIALVMVVIAPVLIGVPLILWRYRHGGGRGRYRPEWSYSSRLEWVLWGVPLLVIGVLGVWLWQEARRLDPYRPLGPQPLQVQAVGLDWKWLFIYPQEGIASVGQLAVPVDRPIALTLTTDTVMQSLVIGPLTGQIYAMPGMITQLNFRADARGTALGKNTQYNGPGFARQKFTVAALAPDAFADWVAQAKTGAALDDAAYVTLRRRSVLAQARRDLGLGGGAGPIAMQLAAPDLFDRIVKKYHPSGHSGDLGGIGAPPTDGASPAVAKPKLRTEPKP